MSTNINKTPLTWKPAVMICCCRCFWRPFCLPRGFKCSHLLHSLRAALLLAFAEEFILNAGVYNSPSPPASVVPASCFFPFFLPTLHFCCPSFLSPPGVAHSFRHGRHLTHTEVQQPKLNQAEIHPSMPENPLYCCCAMEGHPGTERLTNRCKITLSE